MHSTLSGGGGHGRRLVPAAHNEARISNRIQGEQGREGSSAGCRGGTIQAR
jgi:hypothetical protein